jgi:hypothetical protein
MLTHCSLFITTLSAYKGAQAPCLRQEIAPDVISCFQVAEMLFQSGDAVAESPSLIMTGKILSQYVNAEP